MEPEQLLEIRKFVLREALAIVIQDNFPGASTADAVVSAAKVFENYLLTGPKKDDE